MASQGAISHELFQSFTISDYTDAVAFPHGATWITPAVGLSKSIIFSRTPVDAKIILPPIQGATVGGGSPISYTGIIPRSFRPGVNVRFLIMSTVNAVDYVSYMIVASDGTLTFGAQIGLPNYGGGVAIAMDAQSFSYSLGRVLEVTE